VTKYASKETAIVYSIDIEKILKKLLDNQLAAIIDPMGISGYVQPCLTSTQKEDALSKLKTAVSRVEKARYAEFKEKISDAFDWWNLVFDGYFPSYR
jgi:uncharacterized protein (DUF2342 family)